MDHISAEADVTEVTPAELVSPKSRAEAPQSGVKLRSGVMVKVVVRVGVGVFGVMVPVRVGVGEDVDVKVADGVGLRKTPGQ